MTSFAVPAEVRMDTAMGVERQGLAALADGTRAFDLRAMHDIDSSAIAVLLSWQRAATARGLTLAFHAPTPDVMQLAQLYGVSALVFGSTQAS